MKSTDLRIGNYVYYEHTTHIVSGIHGNRVYSWWVKDGEPVIEYEAKDVSGTQVENPYMDVVSQYEPIPLTEEWLLKFEFWTSDWDIHSTLRKQVLDSSLVYDKDNKTFDLGDLLNIKIEYVHQLQNLYFVLTGGELKLK